MLKRYSKTVLWTVSYVSGILMSVVLFNGTNPVIDVLALIAIPFISSIAFNLMLKTWYDEKEVYEPLLET